MFNTVKMSLNSYKWQPVHSNDYGCFSVPVNKYGNWGRTLKI